MDNGFEEITLIHDGHKDDSRRATKIVIIAELKNKRWSVKKITTTIKCWDDRGHTNWSTESCNWLNEKIVDSSTKCEFLILVNKLIYEKWKFKD